MKQELIKPGDIFCTNQGSSCVVVEVNSSSSILVRFIDEYAFSRRCRADHLRNGSLKNPYYPSVYGAGYLGVGGVSPTLNGRSTLCGERWRQMLKRCYERSYQEKNPTYVGVAVCPEWHNFQNFAEWHASQPGSSNRDFELDKDLAIIGSRIYSPETCTFVPGRINCLIGVRSKDNGLQTGVSWHRKSGKFQVDCRDERGIPRFLGWYDSPSVAASVYSDFKQGVLKAVAEQFKGVIDPRVFHNLYSYKVPSID